MRVISRFKSGPQDIKDKLNELIDVVNKFQNISSDGLTNIRQTETGVSVGFNIDRILERIPRSRVNDIIPVTLVMMKITSVPEGKGNYYCKKILIDTTSGGWKDDPDYDGIYTVYNSGEANATDKKLVTGDRMITWQTTSYQGNSVWIGTSDKFAWWHA